MNAIARLIGSVPRLQHGQRWKPSKKKKKRFSEVTWPLFQVLQLTEGNSTVQHAGEWSWWTGRGKEKLPPFTPPLSVLFCVFLGAVGLAGGFLSQPQSRISSTLELESTLLSWFKPPASLRPPPAVPNQPWAVSFGAYRCPLFTTSVCIEGKMWSPALDYKELKKPSYQPIDWLSFS